MVTRTTAKLTGQRNQCPTCGELFKSNAAFSKHRIGKHGINRRCATETEMEADGMVKRGDWWVGSVRYEFFVPAEPSDSESSCAQSSPVAPPDAA